MAETSSGTISFTVRPQSRGRFACELQPPPGLGKFKKRRFYGQTENHAVANALENLARALRVEVEAKQNIDWDAVDRSETGEVINKRFHVIVHYEYLGDDESKMESMVNTMLGNTVVEQAEKTIIQVAPDFQDLAWKSCQ